MLKWGPYYLSTHIHNLLSQSLDELFPSLSDLPEKKSDDSERRERGMKKDLEKRFPFVLRRSQSIQLVDLQDDEGNQIVEEFTSQYVFKYPPDPSTFRRVLDWINPIENGVEGGVETLEGPTLIWGLQPARQVEKTVTYSKGQFTQCILHPTVLLLST